MSSYERPEHLEDKVRLGGDNQRFLTPEEQKEEEENDFKFYGAIAEDQYITKDEAKKRGWVEPPAPPPPSPEQAAQASVEAAKDLSKLREGMDKINERLKGVEAVHGLVANSLLGRMSKKMYGKTVAKAALWHAAAWSVVFVDKAKKITKETICQVSKVLYEGTKEPEIPPPPPKTKDWEFPVYIEGKKGEIKEIIVEPEVTFQCEKTIFADSGQGYHTLLEQVSVGGKLQRPAATSHAGGIVHSSPTGIAPTGALSLFYAPNSNNRGQVWDWCKPGQKIRLSIKFLEDATFHGVLAGQAIDEELPWT